MDVYILFTSHRSRQKALDHLGEPVPPAYYSFIRETGKGVYLLSEAQVTQLAGIKGWRRLRGPFDDLLKCWS